MYSTRGSYKTAQSSKDKIPARSTGLTSVLRKRLISLKPDYCYVIHATLCSKCESMVSEDIGQESKASVLKEHETNNSTLFPTNPALYGIDKTSEPVFRRLNYQNGCRNC